MSTLSNIFILGGTGRVGKQVVSDALTQNHKVTALVRKPNSLPSHSNLTLITGSPTSTTDILEALRTIPKTNASARVTIISTLGQTRANSHNPWSAPTSPPLYMSQAVQALVSALRTVASENLNIEIEKFIVLSAFGTGDSSPYLHWLLRGVMTYSNMKYMIEDHEKVIEIVQENFAEKEGKGEMASNLQVPYVVVRPVMLKFDQPGDVPAVKEYGHGREGMGMMLKCDARSVSLFMLQRVGDDGRLDGSMPVISN